MMNFENLRPCQQDVINFAKTVPAPGELVHVFCDYTGDGLKTSTCAFIKEHVRGTVHAFDVSCDGDWDSVHKACVRERQPCHIIVFSGSKIPRRSEKVVWTLGRVGGVHRWVRMVGERLRLVTDVPPRPTVPYVEELFVIEDL